MGCSVFDDGNVGAAQSEEQLSLGSDRSTMRLPAPVSGAHIDGEQGRVHAHRGN